MSERKPVICIHCGKDFPDCHCKFKAPKHYEMRRELYSQVADRTVGEMLDELNECFSRRGDTCTFKIVVFTGVPHD
jgi:hypothetical protein